MVVERVSGLGQSFAVSGLHFPLGQREDWTELWSPQSIPGNGGGTKPTPHLTQSCQHTE
jgi:hypothetical protein